MPPEKSINNALQFRDRSGSFIKSAEFIPAVTAKDQAVFPRATRTMRKDLVEAKNKEALAHPNFTETNVEKKSPLASLWSKITGKDKAQARITTINAEKAEIERIKAKTEAEQAKAKADAVQKLIEEKTEAEAKAVEEIAKAKKAVEATRKEVGQDLIIKQGTNIKKDVSTATSEAPTTPEMSAIKERIKIETAKKAAEILASHEKAIANTITTATEIALEKEKMRNAIASIAREEETALADVIKTIEKDEYEKAEATKREASQKRSRAEMSAKTAEESLAKELLEANEADITAAKERAEAEAAALLAIKNRALAEVAERKEAEEISLAEQQAQIAIEAVKNEVTLLQNKARAEAKAIEEAQTTAREAEAEESAKITAIKKGDYAPS